MGVPFPRLRPPTGRRLPPRLVRSGPCLLLVLALAGPGVDRAAAFGEGGERAGNPPDPDLRATIRAHQAEPEGFAGWRRAAFVDFGRSNSPAAGAEGYDDDHRLPWVAWSGGMTRFTVRGSPWERLVSDFVEGEDATLLVAAVPGVRYRVLLTLGDPLTDRGPLTVRVDGKQAASGVRSRQGEWTDLEIAVRATSDRIRIRLEAADCGAFAVSGVAVYVPEEEVRGDLPALWSPPDTTAAPPTGIQAVRARRALRAYAAYLVERRPVEGCFSYRGSWYESSFAIRTLLLAAELLREPGYREAAFECLDRFVEEQGPDGSWSATYFGKADCSLALLYRNSTWARNLADVGCMTLCLPLGAAQADRARRAAYLEAARRFADEYVLPNQLESGAFPNLVYEGTDLRHPYSVATGTQASSLTALYAMTGEKRYLTAAERAARFLVADFVDERTIRFRTHGSSISRKEEPGQLGDLLYVLEGLIWVERYGSPSVREAIRLALTRYFEHPRGLRTWPASEAWLTGANGWENSKRAGLLFLLAQYGTRPEGDTPFHRRWREDLLRALENPARVEACGVLADPDGPHGRYALAATGFAGMGMASLIRPGSLFPARNHRWREP